MSTPLTPAHRDHFVRNFSLPIKALRGLAAVVLLALSSQALADGTETLGAPVGVTIASGTSTIAAGVGLSMGQPGAINVAVPAGATVKQVLLYWEGQSIAPATGDDTIVVNGNSITGSLIGGPTVFFTNQLGDVVSSSYRADITTLALVGPGANVLSVQGLDFGYSNDGAGVLVILDDGSGSTGIDVRDGNDLAFINFSPPLDGSVAQTFNFAAASVDRTVNLAMFFADVEGQISGYGNLRPTVIEITVGGVLSKIVNALNSVDGEEWDTLNVPIPVPAGVTSVTVQAFSRDDLSTGKLPASFVWIGAFLSVPPICGDGQVNQSIETCDPPGSSFPDNPNVCRNTCTYCGDGNTESAEGEECDDGNADAEDGCSSSCKTEYCGDGIVQPGLGEQCEPSLSPDCTADCHLPEICNDLIDNDGDELVDCLDEEDCHCDQIGRDPGKISFDRGGVGDLLSVHGSIAPKSDIDPVTEVVSFLLSNADGEIYSLTVPGNTLVRVRRNVFRFVDRNAQRSRKGLAQLTIRFFPRRNLYTFLVKAYGNLSAADKPEMALQLFVGDDGFINKSTWTESAHGWKLTLPGE